MPYEVKQASVVVKSERYLCISKYTFALAVMLYMGYLWFKLNGILGIVVCAVCIALFVLCCIPILRTFVFDENGITVLLWKYKKFIPWNCVRVEYESYVHSLKILCDNLDAIVFYQQGQNKGKNKDPWLYCVLHHPLSFVYVSFPESEEHPNGIFTVDRKTMVAHLKQWGVVDDSFMEVHDPYHNYWWK